MSCPGVNPYEETYCPECGACQDAPYRITGGHYAHCGFFSAAVLLDEQRAEAAGWADAEEGPPMDDPNVLPPEKVAAQLAYIALLEAKQIELQELVTQLTEKLNDMTMRRMTPND